MSENVRVCSTIRRGLGLRCNWFQIGPGGAGAEFEACPGSDVYRSQIGPGGAQSMVL